MDKQQQFIESIAPKAQEIQRKYGVPASIAIAQAALESGWGGSVKGNNLFGIKAGKTWAGATIDLATHEYLNGTKTGITDKFRAYECVEDSLENYGQFLANNCRYSRVIGSSAHQAADELQRAGYATDPRYADKLKSIINTYNLTQFDDPNYRGYMNGDRFEKTRQRLNQQREVNPGAWTDFMKSFFELLGSIFSGLTSLVFGGSAKEVSAPSSTPTASRVAAVGVPPRS